METIHLENITKKFKNKSVLNNLSLDIEIGSLIHIKGSNGCGKSTLLKVIAGLLTYDSGTLEIPNDMYVGALIENPNFIENEDILYNLKFLYNLRNHFDYDRVNDLCTRFELDLEDRTSVKKYSVGMRQKMGIVQAVMEGQNLILFDEPTRGLDEESIQSFYQLIEELKQDNKTIVICAHDGVSQIPFDTVYKMEHGNVSKL